MAAIVDQDERRAAALGARYPEAQSFPCLEEALSHIQPAVVHLCTPTATHHQLSMTALMAGAHLIVEKPLAPTLKDTEEIFSRARQDHLMVCPVHQFVFQEGVQRLRSWLPEPEEIVQVTFIIRSAGGLGLENSGLNELAADILPHPLSVLQSLLPGSLETPWSVKRPAPGELRVIGGDCKAGLVSPGISIEISLNARPTQNCLVIATRSATFHADFFHGFAFRVPGAVSRSRKIVQPFETSMRQIGAAAGNLAQRFLNRESAYPGLRRLVTLFYDALRTGGPSPITNRDCIAVARARQAILFT